jgi:hypothetical protein
VVFRLVLEADPVFPVLPPSVVVTPERQKYRVRQVSRLLESCLGLLSTEYGNAGKNTDSVGFSRHIDDGRACTFCARDAQGMGKCHQQMAIDTGGGATPGTTSAAGSRERPYSCTCHALRKLALELNVYGYSAS